MTLEKIAQLAGVSVSTVSRVLHNSPQVAPATATAVRRVMESIEYEPPRRLRGRAVNGRARPTREFTCALVVIGDADCDTGCGFERLLRGVSGEAAGCGLQLDIRFVRPDGDADAAEAWARRLDGVLLHGEQPGPRLASVLRRIPAVWLMANRDRPGWGDQVLPDNTAIGECAAGYLARRGHQHVAFCSVGWDSWSMEVRSRAFCRSAQAKGVSAVSMEHRFNTRFSGDAPREAAHCLVGQLLEQPTRPTGLFIAEDRQVPPITEALRGHGLEIGPGRDAELISCNNEPSHLIGVVPMPATIDIRAQEIGKRGVERLLGRMRGPGEAGRVRTLIEPVLIDACVPTTGQLV